MMNINSTEILLIQCPTCAKSLPWDVNNRSRPFCCERCKLIDLGEWASEQHVITGKPLLAEADPQALEDLVALLAEYPEV